MKKAILLIIFCLLIVSSAFSQFAAWKYYNTNKGISELKIFGDTIYISSTGFGITKLNLNDFSYTHFTKTNSGIKHPYIASIAKDSTGKFWYGASNNSHYLYGGLFAYDGSWQHFYRDNSDIPINDIRHIVVDKNNMVWVASLAHQCCIAKYDGNNWISYNTQNSSIPSADIQDVIVRKNGDLVFSFFNKGVGILNVSDSSWLFYDTLNSMIANNNVTKIKEDVHGKLWFVYKNKNYIDFYDDTSWGRINIPYSLPGTLSISDIAFDTTGVLWVGLGEYGVMTYDWNTWQYFNRSNTQIRDFSARIIEIDTATNSVYIGGIGLYKYNGTSWEQVKIIDNEINWNYYNVLSLYSSTDVISTSGPIYSVESYNGNLWQEHLNSTYNTITNFGNKLDIPALRDNNGFIWSAMNYLHGGIIKYDGNIWELIQFDTAPSLQNSIEMIGIDTFGYIYASTHNKIIILDPHTNTVVDSVHNPLLITNFIKSAKSNKFWIGGSAHNTSMPSLYYFDSGQLVAFNLPSAINHQNRYSITYDIDTDSKGNFWILTDIGLIKFDGNNWFLFDSTNSPLSYYPNINHINYYYDALTVEVDIKDNVWVGTSNNYKSGLLKFDGINWTDYSVINSGLNNQFIEDIDVDEKGCVWVSTSGGGINVFCCPQPEPNPFDSIYFICPQAEITLSIPENYYSEILWSTGELNYTATFNDTGLVWLYTKDKDGCSQTHKTWIRYYPEQEVLTSDTFICSGETITLSLDGQYSNIIWSNGFESHYTEINEGGNYSVSYIDTNNCNREYSFNVIEKNKPYINLGNDIDSVCIPPYTILADSTSYNYLWSTGDTTHYTTVNESGLYFVQVSNECGYYVDSIEINFFDTDMLKIYTAFSPNGDGIHDVFYIPNSYSNLFFELKIYDLTGQLVFYSNDINQGWDGTNNNTPVASGTYGYVLTVLCDGIPLFKRGTILVLN